ncbi:MAG: ROK family transcriptional regulator [Clostridium sp.]|nr:ROK family transcriptional regulator [Clostridium sp.]
MAQDKERTGKPALMKELNIGLIMDALQSKGQATRVELAALTKLSQPTVNMLIGELVKEQAVVSLGIAASTGGRRAELFAPNSKRAALAAVLIKTDVIEAVVTDLELHTELHEKRRRVKGVDCTEELVALLSALFEKRTKIRALCVGVPGSVSADGEVFAVPAIPEWEHFRLKAYLESRFSVSVCVMNDMNAIAAGYLLGTKKHVQNFVYLHAEGVGMGAGIVIGGKLYSGFRSFAGEVGSMLLGTAEADAGQKEAFGTEKSASDAVRETSGVGESIADAAREVSGVGESIASAVRETPDMSESASLRGCSVEGRMLAAADRQSRAAILTSTVVNLICVLNPEEILFGGDITEELMRDICRGCRAYLPESVLPSCRVVTNYMEDYFDGLCRQGREMLSRHIRVV